MKKAIDIFTSKNIQVKDAEDFNNNIEAIIEFAKERHKEQILGNTLTPSEGYHGFIHLDCYHDKQNLTRRNIAT